MFLTQIVALEQTSKSTKLSEYKFPERVVLLLGREKTGVPYNLLQVRLESPSMWITVSKSSSSARSGL